MNSLRNISAVVFALVTTIAVAEWKPVDGPMKTRWTDQVTPDNVLPEHPRFLDVAQRGVEL